ncbi:MAG: ribose-phosphate pyrophosphokinase [Actinomycetia bacterium]|nr:ribose-phosphate pyrophosphokinase [Actinomycetes bacterium]
MTSFDGLLFALDSAHHLGATVADHLGVALAAHEVREFEGGEHKMRPLVNVRGRDVYVVASLAGDEKGQSANDKLCRLLFFIGALNEASARSVTAVVPYLCYSRKDQQTKAHDPVSTRYVAQLFEAIGSDRLITVDVHNLAAFQNAARCRTDHLEATQLFVDHVQKTVGQADLVVVSPDIGGVKRAERFRRRLQAQLGQDVDLAFAAKLRSRDLISGPDQVLGDIEGRVAIVIDDMISSGGTMRRVADMLVRQGATDVHLVATHGVLSPEAAILFSLPSISSIIMTDSIPLVALRSEVVRDRLVVLGLGPLLAEAVARIQAGGSVADLLHTET